MSIFENPERNLPEKFVNQFKGTTQGLNIAKQIFQTFYDFIKIHDPITPNKGFEIDNKNNKRILKVAINGKLQFADQEVSKYKEIYKTDMESIFGVQELKNGKIEKSLNSFSNTEKEKLFELIYKILEMA